MSLQSMRIVSELLQARAKDSGKRVFCSFRGQQTTCEQLLAGVQEMAGALRQAGAKPGDRVGLMLGQSVEHIELFLAISWIGATVVFFNPHLKSAGIELQLNSSRPRVLVANRVHADAIRRALPALATPPSVVWFEDGVDGADEFHLNVLLRTSRAVTIAAQRSLDDAIVISYTSGTTGAPKGAVLSERFYWVATKNAAILSDAQRDDTILLWEPMCNGNAWPIALMALHKGPRIHIVERFSASRLWDQIAEAGATKFHYVGGLVNIILAQPPVDAGRNNSISIAWGSSCPADSWRRFEDRFELMVREGYGLTEAQNYTHMNLHGVVGSIGTPVEEFDSSMADHQGKAVGPGVVGEIVLKPKSPSVAMTCYWGAPEKTAEVLRDRCVYTGDLGMVDQAGNFYFKGRKKDAMRRRGQNVSAWEVERVLNAAPDVEDSAMIGVDSGLGDHDQEILAVIKLRDGARADPVGIIGFCAEQLAYYQVPRFIQFVNEFPRGPTQRILKKEIAANLENAWDAEKAGLKPKRTV
ncbi:AMP-binding protein [Bradyrhizobium cenepequi]|uniref:AMP-binding protein n=1 Tax=Bradyrhizobium cenepequi TaxID=2821403 RepID=UPI001CE24B70|nr:AMP-binding protein [Bradyrhizobium cenepequi]MCA6113061.1 AMP-binding protein [Bradyrhizobium cenepequi]